VLALFSNLPFESLSKKKKRSTLEAIVNWIGSPQSAFTTTIFNIYQIRNCKQHICSGNLLQRYIDSFFVLSCINQYYYARYSTILKDEPDKAKMLEDKRNTALFYGLFRPLTVALDETTPMDEGDVRETSFLLAHLAFQLRMLRRHGVYPMTLNIVWFFVAFVVSLVLAFADLGDNTTAHSLALGIALCWLPALVVLTIVDRNPVSPTRCRILIDRWLYNVNAIIEFNEQLDANRASNNAQNTGPNVRQRPVIRWWNPQSNRELTVGEFVGQGRRLRHCGVTNTVLERLVQPRVPRPDKMGNVQFMGSTVEPGKSTQANGWTLINNSDVVPPSCAGANGTQSGGDVNGIELQPRLGVMRVFSWSLYPKDEVLLKRSEESRPLWREDDTFELYKFLATDFEKDLVKRPKSWWICWASGGFVVSSSIFLAFMLSFNTPTVGLGCRSMTWGLFWLLSTVSWGLQAIWQEPPRFIRWFSVMVNTFSFALLMFIMLADVRLHLSFESTYGFKLTILDDEPV
jgi:hypothetical protein